MPLILALWEGEPGGWLLEVRSLRPAWPKWQNFISSKNTKISWVWWRAPVIPATQETEAGELLEPRRQRLQWAEISPLHSSLVDWARHHLGGKKKKKGKGEEWVENSLQMQSYLLAVCSKGKSKPVLCYSLKTHRNLVAHIPIIN